MTRSLTTAAAAVRAALRARPCADAVRHRGAAVLHRPVPPAGPWAERLEPRALLAVFTVTTVADDGPGSLRAAIEAANTTVETDTVAFAVPGAGVHTIRPLSELPRITAVLTIDGTTQPGYAGTPLIELDGSAITEGGPSGLRFEINAVVASSVRGLAVNRFYFGLYLGVAPVRVEGNFIGTDPSGLEPRPNNVGVRASKHSVIGGPAPTQRNVISANRDVGVEVLDGGSLDRNVGVVIQGNYIGTDATGTRPLGSQRVGVRVGAQPGPHRIGGAGPGEGNVISGNTFAGLRVETGGTTVEGNLIGTNASGAVPVPNGTGVLVTSPYAEPVRVGGPAAGQGNVISGNAGDGVRVEPQRGLGVLVEGNSIGTDRGGTADVGNRGDGVAIVRSSNNRIAGNTIARNHGSGVVVFGGTGNVITGNSFVENVYLPIDLVGDRATPNDPGDLDEGPNRLQNYPFVAASTWPGFGTNLYFQMEGRPNRVYRVEFFFSGRYAASSEATSGPDGFASATIHVPWSGYPERVTATATDLASGDTSEVTPHQAPLYHSRLVAAHYFYNNSAFDGFDPAANAADDNAIATDKMMPVMTPPDHIPRFDQYTSYDKGINGVMLDVVPETAATAENFLADFEVYDVERRRTVRRAAPPATVTVRRGAGVWGTDRVTLTWPDRSLTDGWLSVRYRENPTQSGGPIAGFGNLVGDTGGVTSLPPSRPGAPPGRILNVNALDYVATRRALSRGPAADITSAYDHNRDGRVNALDVAIVRANLGSVLHTHPWYSSGI